MRQHFEVVFEHHSIAGINLVFFFPLFSLLLFLAFFRDYRFYISILLVGLSFNDI